MRQRTDQLERGQALEVARNRIMEMLVSNEPLESVLSAIARLVQAQLPGALCIALPRRAHNLGTRNLPEYDAHAGGFVVGAAPDFASDWLQAIVRPRAVPFEVWRQQCEYGTPGEHPAWRVFRDQLKGAVPATIRSLPVGESGAPLGAMLLMYPESPGSEPWDKILRASARLAQIAIQHRRFCDELDYQAHHDSLTGLANRARLDELLESSVQQARSQNQRLAFLYIDIDAFKHINDHYSHRAGDALLVEVASRMKAALRAGDTVARIGGDEFNAVLPDIGDAASARDLAARVLEAVRQPISVDGHELAVTVSIGIAIFPDDGREVADLQRQADAAMYYAKSLGKNRAQLFSDNAPALDSVRLEQDLRHALQEGWFAVYYQPKFTAEDDLAGLEALIRLNHPRNGQILPGQFILIAESTGLIVPIGAWVIAEVCRQIADWRARNRTPVVVAVNVSAIQISRSDFAQSVEACLAAHSVPAGCLELEVTESMVVNADSEEHRQMQLLRDMGVVISIDDFGTGFSSLSYLHRLNIDAVKLDRSFVQTIGTDERAQRLVRAMIGVAQGLGLSVVAEGVETIVQRAELVAAGCPVMQGYLFAHPGPPEMVEPLLCLDLPSPAGAGMETSKDLGRLYEALDSASKTAAPSREEEPVPV